MEEIASSVKSQLEIGTALASIGKYAPIIGTFIALSLGIYFVSHVLKKGSHGRGGM